MLKAYAIGFFGAVVAILIVAGIWLLMQPKQEPGLVWGNKVYTTEQEFKGYLKTKGLSYKSWVARNPGAAPWEPVEASAAKASTTAAGNHAVEPPPSQRQEEEWAQRLRLTTILLLLSTMCALLLIAVRGRRAAAFIDARGIGRAIQAAVYRGLVLATASRRVWEKRQLTEPRASEPRTVPPPFELVTVSAVEPSLVKSLSPNPYLRREVPTGSAPSSFPQLHRDSVEPFPHAKPLRSRRRQTRVERDVPVEQVCEIHWWRGQRESQFYVEAKPQLERLIKSRMFRAYRRGRHNPAPIGSAAAAHSTLVEELVAAGWEPCGRGQHWFSDRFRR